MNSRTPLFVALVVLLLSSGAARAQGFGRWWWESTVGYGQRSYDNFVEEEPVSRFDEQDLRLNLGVNGFVVDPSVARFHLGLDLLVSKIEGGRGIDEQRIGGEADLVLFPRGKTPMRFFAEHRLFDYTKVDPLNPFVITGLPDTNTRFGGQLNVKTGPLDGMVMGFERNSVAFLDPEANDDVQDRQFLEWSGVGAIAQHYVRFERFLREYGAIGLGIEDLTLNLSERAQFGDDWNWQMSGIGISRTIERPDEEKFDSDSFRLRNRFFHPVREKDLLDLNYGLDWYQTETGSGTTGHDLLLIYRWRPTRTWEIAPFSQYLHQSGGELSLRSPRLGLSVTFSRPMRNWDTTWTSRASYGQIELSDLETTEDDSNLALFLTGTIGHGKSEGFRQELEIELSHNELTVRREPIPILPDLDPLLTSLGKEDYARGRVTLGRRWGRRILQVWGQWSLRESRGFTEIENFVVENFTGTLQLGGARFNIGSSVGQTTVEREIDGPQNVDFLSATLSVRPLRRVDFRASYRSDRRNILLAPDVDSERYQVSVTIRVLGFVLEGVGFETNESLFGGPKRTNRGVVWSISRRFAGWLPIVTSSGPRGVIR